VKRLPVVLPVLAALACTTTTDQGRNASVQVSFATQAQTAAASSPRQPSLNVVLVSDTAIGGDTLKYSSVEIVLREVELKPVASPTCSPGGEDDPCEEFHAGPALVSLPLAPGAEQTFALDSVPAATYGEVSFEVHRAEGGNAGDQAFLAAHPDFAGISIRIRGTFNGQAFEFTTGLDIEQELSLTPALVVATGTSTNITIFVDVGGWFVSNGTLLDPASADPSVVEENIKRSFGAFEDRDRSGSHD
jgi:hypothetical protein